VPCGHTVEAISLRTEAIANFKNNGFMSVSKFVAQDEMDELRRIGANLITNRVGYAEGMLFDFYAEETLQPEMRTAQLFRAGRHDERLNSLPVRKEGLRIAQQLLGSNARFISDSFFFKPALMDATTPWHQDEAFGDPDIEIKQINIWIPLQPVDLENGCLQFSWITPRACAASLAPRG
jgi:hypothetical protein